MRFNKIIALCALCAIAFSACVSKKKYLEMESLKLNAEKQVRQLTKENGDMQKRVSTMIADYETIKAEMLATNAHKDQLISNLHKEMAVVSSSAASKNSDMEDQLYAYQYEKRQLQTKIDNSEKNVQELTARTNDLAAQLGNLQSGLSNMQFESGKKDSEITRLNQQIQSNGNVASKYQSQVAELNTQIEKLKKASAEKDQTITRLQNNVDLLKKELNK
ncbi:MAG: hypothetical protein ACK5IJ_00565 [Mangrovibacterium sp.]